jgi:hypothetical protein
VIVDTSSTEQEEHQVSSHDADQQPESTAQVSERKQQANRENARRATGPRTAAGKQASSMNALKYGAFATMSVAISRGAFAEDPDELEGYIADIVESLRPRDALEREEANRVAIAYLRADRLSRYEAEIRSGPRTRSANPLEQTHPLPLAGGSNARRATLATRPEIRHSPRRARGLGR